MFVTADDRRPNPSETPAGSAPLTAALGWMTGRLVEALEVPDAGSGLQLSWGIDAASSPPEYWHWIYLRNLERLKLGDERPTDDLPTDGPLMSIVVPVYRPYLWYFRECVQSVVSQSYQNWELCLCDDGSEDPELTKVMLELAAGEPRIKALALERNGGISKATNEALRAAGGDFIVLLDHDDVLAADALAEVVAVIEANDQADVIYSDEDKLDELGRQSEPHFKPDWDPDLLLGFPYLGHLMVIRHELINRIGGCRSEFDGAQDYDIMVRATELARQIVHIPKVLYSWRVVGGSAAGDPEAKPWAHLASRRVLKEAVVRQGIDGTVESGPAQGSYFVRRRIEGAPTVSVIIPYRDQASLTVTCLETLEQASGYPITDVVLVDNGSVEPETRALHEVWERRPNTRVLDYPGVFNWAAINNFAAATCDTDMLLFLNNDIEATSEGWLEAMVELGQRPDVGAVGARLIYPDGKLQHAGVVLGLSGVAGHLFNGMPKGAHGYFRWDQLVRGYSAVTAACMLVRRQVFEEVSGFDESFAVAFNDVDFCLRLGQAGYRQLYTPLAELTHHESVSRGLSGFHRDYQRFLARWTEVLRAGDPYYNPNLGRLEPWCPLRLPGEDEKWMDLVGGLIGVQPAAGTEEATGPPPSAAGIGVNGAVATIASAAD
jgi:GT2 family glycosyltransferase